MLDVSCSQLVSVDRRLVKRYLKTPFLRVVAVGPLLRERAMHVSGKAVSANRIRACA